MENLFEHLVKAKGKDVAYNLVYWMNSYMKIGAKATIDRQVIFDLREAVPMIGYDGCIDELANFYRLGYPIEKFIDDVDESEFHNIILDFELWDRQPPAEKFFGIVSRCLKQ